MLLPYLITNRIIMNDLIFATHNQNKTDEIRAILPQYNLQSLADIGFTEEIEETGKTLKENALIKAQTIFDKLGKPCFADDTGLEVHALGGAPGVYSARYSGKDANSEKNMDKLLSELSAKHDRSAAFKTVIAYIDENGAPHFFEGTVEGEIIFEKRGERGFGYDPLFVPAGYEQTFAQMTPIQKNEISHRSRAVALFVSYLRR